MYLWSVTVTIYRLIRQQKRPISSLLLGVDNSAPTFRYLPPRVRYMIYVVHSSKQGRQRRWSYIEFFVQNNFKLGKITGLNFDRSAQTNQANTFLCSTTHASLIHPNDTLQSQNSMPLIKVNLNLETFCIHLFYFSFSFYYYDTCVSK